MKQRTSLCAASAFLAATLCGSVNAAEMTIDYEAVLEPIFESLDSVDAPGVSVAVIRNGNIVFAQGYGVANLEYGVQIDPDTAFHVASVSKQFTGMAITLLALEGKVDIGADVRTYLPWVPVFKTPITIRQLLHHNSGIRNQWDLLALAGWMPGDGVTQQHVRSMISRQTALDFTPGSDYAYSNTGYSLLADVVEAVSGQSFPAYLQEKVFAPLEMTRSHFHGDLGAVIKNRAYSYTSSGSGEFRRALLNYSTYGATSLFATASDLALWLDNFRHCKVGGCDAIEGMQQLGELQNDSGFSNYGRGIMTGDYRGVKLISHDGRDAGFRSTARWFPESELGIVVLTNLPSIEPGQLADQIATAILGDKLEAMNNPALAAPPTAAETFTPERSVLDRHSGNYVLSNGQLLEVSVQDGSLVAKSGPQVAPMVALSNDDFFITAFGATMEFGSEGADKTQRLTLIFAGTPILGSRVSDTAPMDDAELQELAGNYYCDELSTVYSVQIADGTLSLSHLQRGTSVMVNVASDRFVSALLGDMQFRRDELGRIHALTANTARLKGLEFVKIRE